MADEARSHAGPLRPSRVRGLLGRRAALEHRALPAERHGLGLHLRLTPLQFILGPIGGPVLATAVLAAGGYAWAFGINAATFVGPILAMAYLYRRDLGRGVSREMQRASAAVRSGIGAYVRAQPWVVSALLAVISTSAILEVVRTTAPVLVAQRLGAPGTRPGLVIAAPSTDPAVGLLAYIPMRRWDISRQIPVIGLALQAARLIPVSIPTTLPLAAAGVAAIGCGFSLGFPIVAGVLATAGPRPMRRRRMSVPHVAP